MMNKDLHINQCLNRHVLIVTAVETEREAVLRGLGDIEWVDVLAAGVGPVMVAARTAMVLAKNEYDLVIIAGIGGGFVGQAEMGGVVVANRIIAADLGAETPDGYLSLDELGFGSSQVPVDECLAKQLVEMIRQKGVPVTLGPICTLSTVTGTAETASKLTSRVPSVAAEAMEGFGVATAALLKGIPVLEIRAISNWVGPRDRSNWQIGNALKALEVASASLKEVLI